MGEHISVSTPEGEFSAYVARPKAAQAPAVVVIQEIFGVNQVMRDITDGLAEHGYLAICPDLFWRIEPGIDITDKSEAEWKRAFELFNAFDVDQGVKDIKATIKTIREDAGSNGKVGAVGFCLGGKLAFLTATRTDVDAAVSYYGVGLEGIVGEAEKLTRPLLMHIAEEDQFVPKEAQAIILQALKDHPQVEIHTYAGRDHAFARVGGEHYDEADAKLAGGRTLQFFQRTIG
ncbi:MAG: dienelactone hydrolase family protein [Alphaproteobacteria bacterium]|nr:dienelactone hydrolase family protein [Alphaproteobacteria bacterium]MBU1514981.1 dienelactone hydrolase family protein [Alphaproteobacteria bacterium]MBU2095582.1 dienelactone hydrolase family protein [Alphaproteobacteria bacterium]MBU2149732.1 dienelactone hydrolase family protein [Alphaproteobacteria bacterium]MBU2309043.1 dienelactone hydrolase family protein [Alphaproteobacteria bacterium]